MTPPDPKKRVSARPAAQAPAKPAVQVPKAPLVPKIAAPSAPPTDGKASNKKLTKSGKKKPRIAARRGSLPPAPPSAPERHTQPPSAAGKAAAESAAAEERAKAKVKEPAAASAPPTAAPQAEASAAVGKAPHANEAPKTQLPARAAVASSPSVIAEPAPLRATVPPPQVEAEPIDDAADDADIFGDASGHYSPATRITPRETETEAEADVVAAQGAEATIERLSRGSSHTRRNKRPVPLLMTEALTTIAEDSRRYGVSRMRALASEVDEFGFDPHFEDQARPLLNMLVKHYFRVDVSGAHNIPSEGRAVVVANRSGTLPWDGLILRSALREARPELSPLRWLAEDSIFHYPFLGIFMNRLGAVRACPENAERLLKQERLVVTFPEGAQGSNKLFSQRYQLQRFGRGGYVKLALKHRAPILPIAIIGAEETNPLLRRSRMLGRSIGAEFLPITPTFPWLGPLGLLPAPVKWRILVGEPIDLSSYEPDAAEDGLVVHRLNEQVRSILQSLVDQGVASRKSVLFS